MIRSTARRWRDAGRVLLLCIVQVAYSAVAEGRIVRLPITEGRDIRFTHLSTEEGLSQSRVDHILQDAQGFLWIGTYNGLNRYDGYHFQHYKPQANVPNSIGGVFIYALFQDRSGALWIAVDQGLDRFDPVRGNFVHYRSNPADPASLAGHVEHITQDSDGMLWLATRNGLDRVDPRSGRFTHYRNDPNDPQSLGSNDVRFVLEDRQGTLWVATAAGPDAFDRRTGKVIQHYPSSQQPPLDRIFEDRSGALWLCATRGGGLTSLDRKTGIFTTYTFFDEWPGTPGMRGCSAILEDQRGMLWLATKPDGVVRFDRTRRMFTRYRNDPANPTSLNNNDALSLIEDQEGGIWVGTNGGGVNRFPSEPSPFTIYRSEPGNPNSLYEDYVLSVFEDSHGILWIGTKRLNRLDRKTGEYALYRHDPANSGSIAADVVSATVEDRAGFLWFGTWGGGLNRFDRRSGQFKAYKHDPTNPTSLSNDYVLSLLLDHGGNVWSGTEDGLNRLDVRTGRFSVFRFNGPPDSRIYRVLAEDADGSIWMGTFEHGLQRLDVRTGKIVAYRNDPNVSSSLSNNRVNALCVDHSGTLWVGTQDGLDRFDRNTGEFMIIDQRVGLPNNAVEGILEDAAGNLWLSTGSGLAKFDPQARTVKNYFTDDGLPGDEFVASSVYFKSADGEMFFGGFKGLTAFFPDRVTENPFAPPVVLTEFRLFGEPIPIGGRSPLQRSISSTDSLPLSYSQNDFSLEFASLSYANPLRNRYRYQMEGLAQQWTEVDSNHRLVTFPFLPPGNYTFRVQGSSNRGVWNEEGVALHIRILPPWWSTWWFRAFAGVLIVALAWTLYYLRVRSIERRNRELTRLYSALQHSQSELQSQARILQSILESIGDGVSVVDERGEFLLVNPAAEEIVGIAHTPGDPKQWSEKYGLYLPDQTTRYPAAELPLVKAVRGESSNAVEIFARNSAHPQGVWLSVTARPLTDKTGAVRGGVAVFSDVTSHKRAEIELRQAQKMEAVGRLAGGIAHDFNNILGIVIGQSELLLSQAEIERSVRDRIEEIVDAASRAASLTRQLLAFSRKQVLQPSVLNLNTVIAEVENMIRRLIGEDIEVVTALAHDLESVNADPVQIEQVIINLCVNARDAMPNGGRITIETKNTKIERPEVSQHGTLKPGRYVQLSVRDIGKGISQEILSHIFEPFFTTKAPEKGTGLGLATVYGIVHQTGGEIRVETQPEQGSTFSVFLPAVKREGPGIHAVEPEKALRGSETILLVEDAAPLRSVLRELLETFGYTVLEAEDAEQAWHISEQHRGDIALLLTDLSLPNGSGKAVAKALRKKRQGLKVLYMSGYPDNVVSLGIEEAGTDFLQKPFGQEALAQKLRTLLDGEK